MANAVDPGVPRKENFVEELRQFYESRGQHFKPPIFNRQEMDLRKLWHAVQERGGSAKVCQAKHWASVGRKFNPPRSMTNLSYHVKRIYARCLLPYERSICPDLAMSDELDQPGPFTNKRCVDEHIFYGPALVTRNKRQRSNGKGGKRDQDDGGEIDAAGGLLPEGREFDEMHRGLEGMCPADEASMDTKRDSPIQNVETVETEQAAAMLWGLRRSDIKELKGPIKLESQLASAGRSGTDPERSEGNCLAVSVSADEMQGGQVDSFGLEDWYQRKMAEMQRGHEEEVKSLKRDLDNMRRRMERFEATLTQKEAAYQECRWCFEGLLKAIRPQGSEDGDDVLFARLTEMRAELGSKPPS